MPIILEYHCHDITVGKTGSCALGALDVSYGYVLYTNSLFTWFCLLLRSGKSLPVNSHCI